MTTEYVAKIKGDTSNLEKMLKEAQGHLERLNDNEVIVKFDYDENQPELTKIVQKIVNEVPDIDIKFKYDINKAALEREKAKLSEMELSIDPSQITKEIQKIHKQYTEIFEGASDEELDKLENKMSSLYQTLLDMPMGLKALQGLPKEIQEQLEDLEEVEPLKLFSDDAIDKQRAIVAELEKTFDDLTAKLKTEDIGEIISDQLAEVQVQTDETSDSLNKLLEKFSEYSKNKNYNQVSSFWNELKTSVANGNEEAIQLLNTLKLIDDETKSINIVQDGNVKSGGIIGSDRVLLATKNRQLGDSDRLENTNKLKEKLDEAAEAGINVSRILDVVADSEKKVFLEIQEKASGNILGSYEDSWVNPEIFEATDSQILKLIEDLQKLNQLGIGVDVNPTNILYDKNKGFSFIDLDLDPVKFESQAELLEDALGGITGTIRQFYEDLDNTTGAENADKLEKRIRDVVNAVQNVAKESVKTTQQSNSPSKIGKGLGEDFGEGYAEGIESSIDEVAKASEDLVKAAQSGADLNGKELIDSEEIEKSKNQIKELEEEISSLNAELIYNTVDKGSYDYLSAKYSNAKDEIKELSDALKSQKEQQGIEELVTPLENVIELINKKTEAFREEAITVDSTATDEISNLARLSSALEEIAAQIKAVGNIPITLDVDSNQFKTAAEDIQKAVQGLDLKDSGFLGSIKEILSKGKELENLAKVLSSSSKKIKKAKEETVSKKEKEKTKATEASYQKELALLKEKLKLQHEIDVAKTKGDGNSGEIEAKNQPLIDMLDKQVKLEKDRRTKSRETSKELREQINSEKKAIEERYNAEIKGIKAASAERNRNQQKVNQVGEIDSQIKELETLYGKLETLSKNKGQTPEYISEAKSQMQILKSQIDILNQAKIDLVDEGDVAELDRISEDTTKILADSEEIKSAASDAVNKIAKATSATNLSKEISDYLRQNTKLSRSFTSELDEMIQKLNSGKLNGEELQELFVRFREIQTAANQLNQVGDNFFTKVGKRWTEFNARLIAQYLSIQDLIRYARAAFSTIQELDTALVDLRKTTTMSAEELNDFYYSANNVAKQMGTTTEQIISQAAAWSRLGYSSKEAATEMAALSSQFAAISPGMDLDTATDDLVSTMQAFHIEVDDTERDIMDNVNRIGKYMPKRMATYGVVYAA